MTTREQSAPELANPDDLRFDYRGTGPIQPQEPMTAHQQGGGVIPAGGMIYVTIVTMRDGGYRAFIWNRLKITSIFHTSTQATFEEAKTLAEMAFGPLDWGKGNLTINEASVGID